MSGYACINTVPVTIAAGDTVQFWACLPIVGW